MRLLTVCGVDIRLNLFFVLLIGIYWCLGVLGQAMVIFCAVFLHELGHVVVAKGYGIKVTEVELLPFGGVARMEGNIELNPAVEIYIALAGPLTNAFLVALGYILQRCGMGNQQWLPFFMQSNVLLGLFNLLPAIPLDGGRIFRALVSCRRGLKRATETAAALSVGLSAAMVLAGVWSIAAGRGNFNFLLIAVFLAYCAARERVSAMYIFMKFLARKKEELFREGVLPARQVVAVESSFLKEVVRFFVPRKYHLVVVVGRDQKIRGTLTEGEIIEVFLAGGQEMPVGVLVERKK